jgi:hypothetical protein
MIEFYHENLSSNIFTATIYGDSWTFLSK